MLKSQKNVFWQALLAAILILGTGILVGISIEGTRNKKIELSYLEAEINLLDSKLQNELFSSFPIDCENAIEKNMEFADRIFYEALVLKKYEQANKITTLHKLLHKKYDLLRTFLWVNSIKLKERCDADYYNVIYLYNFNDLLAENKAKQIIFSRTLYELKEELGNRILLIPIAVDNDLVAIETLITTYNVTQFPTILIDEKIKITEVEGIEDIKKYID